jgi:hypothetical protein
MTSQQDEFSKYPQEVRSSTQRSSLIYTRLPDHYAVQREVGGPPSAGAFLTINEGAGQVVVIESQPAFATDTDLREGGRPVYKLEPGGGLALPTGQVFIRFKEGVKVEDHAEKIRSAGYEIAQGVSYAPHAAWLRPSSGDVADGLAKIPALEKIADVENVEPQMLQPRANR